MSVRSIRMDFETEVPKRMALILNVLGFPKAQPGRCVIASFEYPVDRVSSWVKPYIIEALCDYNFTFSELHGELYVFKFIFYRDCIKQHLKFLMDIVMKEDIDLICPPKINLGLPLEETLDQVWRYITDSKV